MPCRAYRFRGRGSSLYVFLVAQMFPGIILLVPLFDFFTSVGLIDQLPSVIIAYSTIAIPFCVLMLKAYFDTIPFDLEEAGMVDGLGVFGGFWRIVLPLSVPGVAVTAFYSFVTAWNEFMLASAFLVSRDKLTLPVGLSTFIDPFNQPWHLLAAASVHHLDPGHGLLLPRPAIPHLRAPDRRRQGLIDRPRTWRFGDREAAR